MGCEGVPVPSVDSSMLPDPFLIASGALLMLAAYVGARRVSDTYVFFLGLLVAAAAVAGVSITFQPPVPAARVFLQLAVPSVIGVLLGSWPDPKRWPLRIRDGLGGLLPEVPSALAILAGLALGIGTWATLSRAFGAAGSLVGIVLCFGLMWVPPLVLEFVRDQLRGGRKDRREERDTPNTQ